jgi:hypothetical protein
MNDDDVRAAAQAVCDAVVAGNVDGAIDYLSDELRRNLGEVLALLPLPATEATIESLESGRGGSAHVVVVRIVGETDEVQLQMRWKDRDGSPRIVEVSHLSRVERPEAIEGAEEAESAEASEPEG